MKKVILLIVCLFVTMGAFASNDESSNDVIVKQELTLQNETIDIYYVIVPGTHAISAYCEKTLSKYNPNLLTTIKSSKFSIVKSYKGTRQYHCNSYNEAIKIAVRLYKKYGHLIDFDKIIF